MDVVLKFTPAKFHMKFYVLSIFWREIKYPKIHRNRLQKGLWSYMTIIAYSAQKLAGKLVGNMAQNLAINLAGNWPKNSVRDSAPVLSVKRPICYLLCPLFIFRSRVHSTHCTLHSTNHTVRSTRYTVHSTQLTVYSTENTAHITQ